jgi:hypothetical protein
MVITHFLKRNSFLGSCKSDCAVILSYVSNQTFSWFFHGNNNSLFKEELTSRFIDARDSDKSSFLVRGQFLLSTRCLLHMVSAIQCPSAFNMAKISGVCLGHEFGSVATKLEAPAKFPQILPHRHHLYHTDITLTSPCSKSSFLSTSSV